jgi:acetylornithine deacetylase/succinyl-diaminopimelate desuccinylase-like protein
MNRRPALLAIAFAALFAGSVISASSQAVSPASRVLSPEAAAQETAAFLTDLIKIDTQDPPGNESKVANYLAAIFQREGIPYELLEPVPGRASIVARLKGSGARRPVLMLAHEDVVPVDRTHWTVDPFAAELRDGTLYGRGASDDKSPLAAHLEIILQLHRSGRQYSRDILFLAEASEETSSPAGMHTLVERYWDKLNCEFAVNEGGAAEVTSGNIPYFGIATGEKLPRGVRLIAKGTSGHASVPVLDNPITHLAQAVARLGTWETPMRLNDTTRTFFSRLATISTPEQAAVYRNLEAPASQTYLHKNLPAFYSMLHTSVVPTVLKGGFKSNVIPPEAEAEIDIRALPDEDLPSFFQQMNTLVDDPSVTILPPDTTDSMPAAPASSMPRLKPPRNSYSPGPSPSPS